MTFEHSNAVAISNVLLAVVRECFERRNTFEVYKCFRGPPTLSPTRETSSRRPVLFLNRNITLHVEIEKVSLKDIPSDVNIKHMEQYQFNTFADVLADEPIYAETTNIARNFTPPDVLKVFTLKSNMQRQNKC